MRIIWKVNSIEFYIIPKEFDLDHSNCAGEDAGGRPAGKRGGSRRVQKPKGASIMQSEMIKGNPLSIIIRFTIPLFIGNVFQQLYNMCDTIIVGRFVGANALAAVGSTGTIMFLILGFCSGLTSGFAVLTAQRYGAGDIAGVKKSVANSFLLSGVLIVVMTVGSLAIMRPLLRLMNTPEEIFADAYAYISVICMGIIASVAYNLLSALLRAVGNSKMPLVVLVFSAVLNVILDLVLIVFFHMGTAGAALATNLAQGISSVLCWLYILKKVPELTPDKGMWRYYPWATARQLQVGIPMALQFGITASGTMIMQAAINLYGATAVAGYTAASKVQGLITQGNFSIGQTMATYVGQNYGAGEYERIRKGVKSAVISITVYAVAAAFLVVVALRPMIALFFSSGTDIDAMMPYARMYIVCCALFYIPLGYIFVFRNAMQGCGYGLLPMLGGVMELACRLALAIASMYTMNYLMASLCDPIAWLGAGIFTAVTYCYVIRRVKETLQPSAGPEPGRPEREKA